MRILAISTSRRKIAVTPQILYKTYLVVLNNAEDTINSDPEPGPKLPYALPFGSTKVFVGIHVCHYLVV